MAAIERKVSVASTVTFAMGLVVALLNATSANSALLGPVPPWLQFVLVALVPALATFLSGYAAPHTPTSKNVPPVPLKKV